MVRDHSAVQNNICERVVGVSKGVLVYTFQSLFLVWNGWLVNEALLAKLAAAVPFAKIANFANNRYVSSLSQIMIHWEFAKVQRPFRHHFANFANWVIAVDLLSAAQTSCLTTPIHCPSKYIPCHTSIERITNHYINARHTAHPLSSWWV